MKYINEYKETNSKKDFITLVLNRYPKIKPATALRRYYDVRKVMRVICKITKSVSKKPIVTESVSKKPIVTESVSKKLTGINIENTPIEYLKYRTYLDMKRLGHKITRQTLRKHGFEFEDVEKLIKDGENIEDGRPLL